MGGRRPVWSECTMFFVQPWRAVIASGGIICVVRGGVLDVLLLWYLLHGLHMFPFATYGYRLRLNYGRNPLFMACSKVDVVDEDRAACKKATKSAGVHDGWMFGEIPVFLFHL
jgi:hypothetical protein